MTLFIIARKYSRILGIQEVKLPNFLQGFPAQSGYRTLVLISIMFNLIAPSLYVILEPTTFEVFAEVLTIVVGVFCVTLSYIVLILDKDGIYQLLDSIDLMIECRNENRPVHKEAHRKYFQWTKRIETIWIKIILPTFASSNMIVSYFMYFTAGKTRESFILIVPAYIPYDWRTPIRFFFTYILQSAEIYYGSFTYFLTAQMFVGVCWFLLSLISDFELSVRNFDQDIVNANGQFTHSSRIEFKERFVKLITFHSDIKKLLLQFSNVYRKITSIVLGINSMFICGSLILTQVSIATHNYSSSYKFLNVIWVFTTWLYLVCSFGDRVTMRLIDINDIIFDCAWYRYPIKLRQFQLMMMMSAQQPIYIEGYLNYKCTLETFKKVMNVCYSVFTLLQRANI